MSELSKGTKVKFTNGSSCTIKKELGRGGQGIVYLVDFNGNDYALKWYHVPYPDAFYTNLKKNTEAGAPSESFIWPLAVTERQNESYGYMMKLRPQGYYELGAFMLAKVKFANVDAVIAAALQICTSFQKLHIRGLSYQDMNDGNFFINPQTGHVLICDNDNVSPNGVNMGIAGKVGFMAPEIVEREALPSRPTDYFSLAVTLFLLFYMNKPFEGQFATQAPCMNEDAERKLNGKEAIFIMDPTNPKNRPVPGMHKNVIRRWNYYPDILKNEFIKTFSHEAIIDPSKRTMDRVWEHLLVQLRSLCVTCPFCGKKTFVNGETATNCQDCGKPLTKPANLKCGKYIIPLVPGQKIYKCQVTNEEDHDTVMGEVVRNKIDPKKWGFSNKSQLTWTVTLPNGDVHNVDPGQGMPLAMGAKIRFSKDVTGEIMK